jgi:hypothetical protein
MTYRAVDTAIWSDPFVESLSPMAKLIFVYLWTNSACNQAGLYVISKQRIEFETGAELTDEIISALKPKIEIDLLKNIVWVKNFFRRQCANQNFAIGALRCVSSICAEFHSCFFQHNKKLLKKYGLKFQDYVSETVCEGYQNGLDTVSDCLQTYAISDQIRSVQSRSVKKSLASPPSKDEIEDASIVKIKSDIEEIAEKLYNEKIFPEVHSFKNKFLKNGNSPRAILHALSRCYLKKTFKDNPWSYCVKILQVENGNYNERDFNKTS